MNATTQNREPAELEREASAIRADMDRTLNALERKFNPQQLLDRSVGYLRDHGGEVTRTIGDTVKQNPIPVLLTAAGIAWLITSTVRSRSSANDAYDADYGDPAYGGTDDASYAGSSTEPGMRDKMRQKLDAGTAKLHERTESMRSSWRSSKASGRMNTAMDATRVRAQQMQQRASTMMDEQPLIIGALALAAGAILGAALPTTQYENRRLGPIRDRTMGKAKEAGEREYQNLRGKIETKLDQRTETSEGRNTGSSTSLQ